MGKGRDIVLRVDIQRAATKRQILGICSSHIMLIGLPSIMFSSNRSCSPKIQPLDRCCLHYLQSPFYLLSPLLLLWGDASQWWRAGLADGRRPRSGPQSILRSARHFARASRLHRQPHAKFSIRPSLPISNFKISQPSTCASSNPAFPTLELYIILRLYNSHFLLGRNR